MYNTNLDLVNINAYATFCQIPYLRYTAGKRIIHFKYGFILWIKTVWILISWLHLDHTI